MLKKSLCFISILTILFSDTVYEDGENGVDNRWLIYDTSPSGAEITDIYDNDKNSNVISLIGSGEENGFWLRDENGEEWDNQIDETINWDMKINSDFMIYIRLMTEKGFRFLVYTPNDSDDGLKEKYIYYGLGSSSKNGVWQSFSRNLETDLKKYEPDNKLISVNGFMIRGVGSLDNIVLLDNEENDVIDENNTITDNDTSTDEDNKTIDDSNQVLDTVNANIYEDAEDEKTNGWTIYDNEPIGSTITNVYDNSRNSRVIKLFGDGINNGYRLQTAIGYYDWNNKEDSVISWSMNFSDDYDIYIRLNTTDGLRYLHYRPIDTDNGGGEAYVEYGLGTSSKDGNWHTYTKDVNQELHRFQPNNDLISIDGFMVRGNGYIDDIYTMKYVSKDELGTDKLPPKIVLTGSADIVLKKGSTYSELGASAVDNVDTVSTLLNFLTIDSSEVNTDKSGRYRVKYTLHDSAGNIAKDVYRFVTVEDNSSIIGSRKIYATPVSMGTIFISPNGTGVDCTESNPCSFSRLENSSEDRIRIKEGDIVFFREGIYKLSIDDVKNISFVGGTSSLPTIYEAYPNERVVFDGSSISTSSDSLDWTEGVLLLSEDFTWFRGMEIREMPTYGIRIFGNNNIVEGLEVYSNHLSGIEISSSQTTTIDNSRGSYNIIRDNNISYNSDAGLNHHNYSDGNNADGITIHTGVSNIALHNNVYGNSDDGIDSWLSVDSEISYNKVYDNGKATGDGNGIKLGGTVDSSPLGARTYAHHNLSYFNTNTGFSINSGKDVVIENNIAYRNAKYGFSSILSTTLNKNISYKNFSGDVGWDNNAHIEEENSWQLDCTLNANLELNPNSSIFLYPNKNSGCETIGAYYQ